MGAPSSPDFVFDFPMDEPEPHPVHDFFAPGPLLGYAGIPKNNSGWIEDVPRLRELGAEVDELMVGPGANEVAELIVEMGEQVIALVIDVEEDIAMLFGDDDFNDDDSKGFKDEEEVWEVNEEWLMAFVTLPLMLVVPPPSTYKVGGPFTTDVDGQSFTLPTPEFPVPLSVIEDLSTCMGNLEYEHGQLVKKVVQAVGRLEQIGTQVEQGQQTVIQRDKLQTIVSKMSSRESTLIQCILRMDRRLADLERRPPGPQ
nr:hypothetical protein [Tanacetum cinerariifolium]